jgi:putative tricarboxylic transport membrane protein
MSAGARPGADRAVGAVLVVLGLAAGAEATTFDVAFVTDPVGPKALPLLAAGMLVLAGAHAILRPRQRTGRSAGSAASAGWKIAAAAAGFFAYGLTLSLLGFFTATTLVVAGLSILYGAPPLKGFAAAALLSAGLWLLFVPLLALPLPIGTLWIR